jgi:hypothetical protein
MQRLPLPLFADRDAPDRRRKLTEIEDGPARNIKFQIQVMVPANPVVGFAQGAFTRKRRLLIGPAP